MLCLAMNSKLEHGYTLGSHNRTNLSNLGFFYQMSLIYESKVINHEKSSNC